ncbi:hypothetical protein E4T56_gene18619 [Termitomyces sp. T112]|nr:hypothetical protein E4T56_gene18619 [Termitomyces sp. T112]
MRFLSALDEMLSYSRTRCVLEGHSRLYFHLTTLQLESVEQVLPAVVNIICSSVNGRLVGNLEIQHSKNTRVWDIQRITTGCVHVHDERAAEQEDND